MTSLRMALPWLVLAVVGAVVPSPAQAWGKEGHAIVAAIAQAHLTPAARAEVQRLFDAVEPGATLESVASWADETRNHATAGWHFTDFPDGHCHYEPAVECRDGNCLVGALQRQLGVLGDRKADIEARERALKYVVHLTGDAAQPLHNLARDRGGNAYQVQFNGRGTNAHAVWDSGLLRDDATQPSGGAAQRAMDRLFDIVDRRRSSSVDIDGLKDRLVKASFQVHIAPDTDVRRWSESACLIANEPGFMPPRRIGADYVSQWQPVMEAQLIEGGYHLAAVLNATLGRH